MDSGQLTVGNAANWYIGKLLRYCMVLNQAALCFYATQMKRIERMTTDQIFFFPDYQ